MRKLNLNRCEISEERFTPNMVMDRNLYDDVCVESGLFTCSLYCNNDESEINASVRKLMMMLEAYNNGYIKSIGGEKYGLKSVFGVIGEPVYEYKGGKNLEVRITIASLSYNPHMHMSVMFDCLSAGISTTMVPDFRKYFELAMDDRLKDEFKDDQIVRRLEQQISAFKETINAEMQPLV